MLHQKENNFVQKRKSTKVLRPVLEPPPPPPPLLRRSTEKLKLIEIYQCSLHPFRRCHLDSVVVKCRGSLGIRISKISGATTLIQNAVRNSEIFAMRGWCLAILSTESEPFAEYKIKSQNFLPVTRRMC